MFIKPARLAVVIIILLVLPLSAVSAEARTFRKPVSNDVVSDQPSAVSNEPQTTNYKPQTAQDSQNCEPTIKRIRGKRVVTNNCAPRTFELAPQANSENIIAQPTKSKGASVIDKTKIDPILINADSDNLKVIIKAKNGEQLLRQLSVDGNVIKFNYGGFYALTVPKNSLATLSSSPSIIHVWPDSEKHALLDVSAPLIKANIAWNNWGYTGSGVKVCILDTGINKNHPNLAGKVILEGDFTGTNDPHDYDGHGTHVAGIVASNDNMFRGIAYGASLINAKVLDNSGNGLDSWIFSGIDWCVGQGANILSMSLGSVPSVADGSSALAQYADTVAEVQGKTIVISAGNEGPNAGTITTPGDAHKVITVGAVYKEDYIGIQNWSSCIDNSPFAKQIVCFSSRGPSADSRIKPDIVAPGAKIMSLGNAGGYAEDSGTSMAAPMVTGAAAIILQAKPSITPEEVKALLINSGNVFGRNNNYGAGMIDIQKTLAEINNIRAATISSTDQEYTVQIPSGASELSVTLVWPENYDVHNNLDLYIFDPSGNQYAAATSVPDTVEKLKLSNPSPAGYWKIRIVPTGVSGSQKYALASNYLTTTSSPPTVSAVANPNPVGVGQTVSYTANANDDNSVYKMEISVDGVILQTCYPNQPAPTASCSYTTSYPAIGTHSFYANAIDNSGNAVGTSIQTLQVVDASMPTISISASPSPVGVGQTVTFTASASDDIQVAIIRLIVDGGTFKECPISAPSGSCSEVSSYGATGTHTYRGFARDSSGNEVSTPEYILTVQQQPGVGPNPVAKISVNKNPVYTGETFTFTVTAQDDFQINTVWVYVEPDGPDAPPQLQATCPGSGASGSCSWTSSFSTAKQHKFQGCTVDNENRFDCDPDSGWYLLDVITPPPPPSPPTVSVSASPAPVEVGQTITITANANDNAQVATIKIVLDGIEVNSCPINAASGSCAYQTSYSTIGSHTYFATATDNEGSIGRDPASGTKSFNVIDTTAPAISASAVPNPVDVGQLITLNATVSDNLKVAWAAIYIDGVFARNCTISSQNGWCSHTPSYPATGAHTYYAVAADISGNRAQTPLQNFNVVDNSAPTIVVSAPASAGVGQNIRIIANATDNAAVSSIGIYVDGGNQSGTVCTGIGTIFATCYKDLIYGSAGTHTYFAWAIDSSSNAGRDPATGAKSFDITNPAPTISVTAPATVEVNTPIRITANATDDSAVSEIKIFVEGIPQTGLTCSGLGTASANCYKDLTYSTLGSHTYYSTATDDFGGTARDPASGTKNFEVIDNTGPVIQPLAINTTDMAATITATASDNIFLYEIKIFVDGTLAKRCIISSSSGSCPYTNTWPVSGVHNAYAIATDSSGNTATAPTRSFTVGRPGVIVLLQGQGWVTSSSNDIQCGFIFNDCAKNYTNFGDKITLTATPSPSPLYVFDGWGGSCSGISKTCTVTMNSTEKVYASFSPVKIPQFYELNVSVTGSGTGKVVSTPTGINCTSGLCSTLFQKGATVTLTATPNGGSTFAGWSGACSGTAATCTVAMSASKSVGAAFN